MPKKDWLDPEWGIDEGVSDTFTKPIGSGPVGLSAGMDFLDMTKRVVTEALVSKRPDDGVLGLRLAVIVHVDIITINDVRDPVLNDISELRETIDLNDRILMVYAAPAGGATSMFPRPKNNCDFASIYRFPRFYKMMPQSDVNNVKEEGEMIGLPCYVQFTDKVTYSYGIFHNLAKDATVHPVSDAMLYRDPLGSHPDPSGCPVSVGKQAFMSGGRHGRHRHRGGLAHPALARGADALVVAQEGGGRKKISLHKHANEVYQIVLEAAKKAGFEGVHLVSGHRHHRWDDYAHYKRTLIRQYKVDPDTRRTRTDEEAFRRGKKRLAFDSPHETGFAFDFGSYTYEGIEYNFGPGRASEDIGAEATKAQRASPFHRWLIRNAPRFGISPYAEEPWHWEVPPPPAAATAISSPATSQPASSLRKVADYGVGSNGGGDGRITSNNPATARGEGLRTSDQFTADLAASERDYQRLQFQGAPGDVQTLAPMLQRAYHKSIPRPSRFAGEHHGLGGIPSENLQGNIGDVLRTARNLGRAFLPEVSNALARRYADFPYPSERGGQRIRHIEVFIPTPSKTYDYDRGWALGNTRTGALSGDATAVKFWGINGEGQRYSGVKKVIHILEANTFDAYIALVKAARRDGIKGKLLTCASGYRSVKRQGELWDYHRPRFASDEECQKFMAKPGDSRHHTGRAIDFWMGYSTKKSFISKIKATKAYMWMKDNAEFFGFYNYEKEPWHWEFNPDNRVSRTIDLGYLRKIKNSSGKLKFEYEKYDPPIWYGFEEAKQFAETAATVVGALSGTGIAAAAVGDVAKGVLMSEARERIEAYREEKRYKLAKSKREGR